MWKEIEEVGDQIDSENFRTKFETSFHLTVIQLNKHIVSFFTLIDFDLLILYIENLARMIPGKQLLKVDLRN